MSMYKHWHEPGLVMKTGGQGGADTARVVTYRGLESGVRGSYTLSQVVI